MSTEEETKTIFRAGTHISRSGDDKSISYSSRQVGGNNPYVNFSARLYTTPWDQEKRAGERNPLFKSRGGRVFTRLLSRGLVGATFMTMGNMAVRSWDPYLPMEEQGLVHKGMTSLATGFDYAFGKPIEAIFGENATHFRSKRNFSPTALEDVKALMDKAPGLSDDFHISRVTGRSLGKEMVGVSFDFAAGSFGDALGREIVAVADPGHKNDWYDDKGHFSAKQTAKSIGKSLWKVVSYHQAEDWFAALPYVYQMHAQRELLASWWPGAKFTFDHQANGGSFRVGNDGQIKGTYMMAGAMDLQARFMGYNFYTLIFRDLYNHTASKYNEWKEHGYPKHFSLPANPVDATAHAVAETTKYTAKSFIKSMLYMFPAVPFFWAFRVPASRNHAFFVSEDGGPVLKNQTTGVDRKDGELFFKREIDENGKPIYTTTSADMLSVPDVSKGRGKEYENIYINGKKINAPDWLKSQDFDPFAKEYATNWFEKTLNPIGKMVRRAGRLMDKHVTSRITEAGLMSEGSSGGAILESLIGRNGVMHGGVNSQEFANSFVNNSFSYTPYMIAKYETANHIDMPIFDAATYRMLDGIQYGNWNEIKAGFRDMGSVIVHGDISPETLEAARKPRGLTNSMHETKVRTDQRQAELKHNKSFAERVRNGEETDKEEAKPAVKDGWAAYETSRNQERESGAPDGSTIH